MITRRKIRNGLSWAGIAVGIAGVVLYLFSLFATLTYEGPLRELAIGRGVVQLEWYQSERTRYRPDREAAPIQVQTRITPPVGTVLSFPNVGRVIYTGEDYFPAMAVRRQVQFRAASAWQWMPQLRNPGGTEAKHWDGSLVIPAWMLVLLGVWCAYRRLPWDVTPGTCPKCMFDLTGTPPLKETPGQVRCPECGKVSRRALAAV